MKCPQAISALFWHHVMPIWVGVKDLLHRRVLDLFSKNTLGVCKNELEIVLIVLQSSGAREFGCNTEGIGVTTDGILTEKHGGGKLPA